MTHPLDEFGCDFYAGNARLIGQACIEDKWSELRSGQIASMFVGFPTCVHSLDVLMLLPKAISEATRQPEIVINGLLDKVAGDEGTWGAEVLTLDYVRGVAEIPIERVIEVWQQWLVLREQEYGYDEDWQSPAIVESLFGLKSLCGSALAGEQDVVLVWTL